MQRLVIFENWNMKSKFALLLLNNAFVLFCEILKIAFFSPQIVNRYLQIIFYKIRKFMAYQKSIINCIIMRLDNSWYSLRSKRCSELRTIFN